MRKVTAGLFHSLDGAVEAPHEWQFDRFDDELGGLLTGVLGRTDTVIMGRKGFSEWAGYWPNAEVDAGFADFINAVPKHVATRTLTTLPAWQNSSIIAGDLDTFVRELKAKDGGEIAVMASISVVNQLFPRRPARRVEAHHPPGAGRRQVSKTVPRWHRHDAAGAGVERDDIQGQRRLDLQAADLDPGGIHVKRAGA